MVRASALLLTVLTGSSGLVYQVAWQKYLAILLGSHAEATAAVLAIFLGGLALGYSLFGALTRRRVERARAADGKPRLLRLYGAAECAIGAYAWLFPWLFGGVQALSFTLPHENEALGFAFDVLLTSLLLGPPTVLMGATIPVLTQGLARDLSDATRVHAWVYAFNTAGAFVGALAGGFLLVPLLGLDGVMRAMALVNLSAGAIFLWLGRRPEPAAAVAAPSRSSALSGRFLAFAVVALLGGFAMMALQTVLNRIGGLAFGASHFTFAMVVAAFVLCIALGSFAVSALRRIPPALIVGSQWALVLALALLYFQLPDATYWAWRLRASFGGEEFYRFHLAAFAVALAVLAIPIGLSGALLPLLFHHLRREVGDLGSVAGRLYGWNTLGSLLGALLGGYVLLFWLDLHHVYRVSLAALVVGAALLTILVLRQRPLRVATLLVLPGLAAVVALPAWDPDRLSAGLFRLRARPSGTAAAARASGGPDAFFARLNAPRVVFHDDGPAATIDIKKDPPQQPQSSLGIYTNGKGDGHLVGDYPTTALCGLLPALMAEEPRRAFVIGFGTGVTAGELAALEQVEEVVVAEIARGVIEASPLFEQGNLGATRNPKVRIVRSDAYRTLLRSPGAYDVIVSEPSNPWVTGVEMLYSLEFLGAARSKLRPGGVYAQWFHLYETDPSVITLVLRNYATAFGHVSIWFTKGPDVLLLGFDRAERALDVTALEERASRRDFSAGWRRVGITSFPALLAHELLPLGALHAARVGPGVHTLRHPILSDRAARAFFRNVDSDLPMLLAPEAARVGARNALLGRYLAARGGDAAIRALEQAARETCARGRPTQCTALLARWAYLRPGSPRLERALTELREAGHHPPGPLRLRDVSALYDPEVSARASDGDALARARSVTERFTRFYHHPVPFPLGTLRLAWAGCAEGPEARRCRAGRRRAEALVGSLAPPGNGT